LEMASAQYALLLELLRCCPAWATPLDSLLFWQLNFLQAGKLVQGGGGGWGVGGCYPRAVPGWRQEATVLQRARCPHAARAERRGRNFRRRWSRSVEHPARPRECCRRAVRGCWRWAWRGRRAGPRRPRIPSALRQ
jgi:hypothetical protein